MSKEFLSDEELRKLQMCELEALVEFDRICKEHNIHYSLYGGTLLGAIRHNGFIPWDDDIDVVVLRDDYEKLEGILSSEMSSKFFFQNHNTDKNWYRLYSKIRINGTIFKECAHASRNIHQGVYIDIFPLDCIPADVSQRKRQETKFKIVSTILSAKYIDIKSRKGLNKLYACILRLLCFPCSLEYLYNKAIEISGQYNTIEAKEVKNFTGPYGKKEIFPKSFMNKIERVQFEGNDLCVVSEYEYVLKQMYGNYMQLPPLEKRVTHHPIENIRFEDEDRL